MKTLLFVYGTLKRGCSNHRQMAGQEFLATAETVPGFRLHNFGGYPGIGPGPRDAGGVHGEVWQVDDTGLQRLDAFEGVPEGLYERRGIPLQPPFDSARVQAYFPAGSPEGRKILGAEWTG